MIVYCLFFCGLIDCLFVCVFKLVSHEARPCWLSRTRKLRAWNLVTLHCWFFSVNTTLEEEHSLNHPHGSPKADYHTILRPTDQPPPWPCTSRRASPLREAQTTKRALVDEKHKTQRKTTRAVGRWFFAYKPMENTTCS